jgi:hypothetical protein
MRPAARRRRIYSSCVRLTALAEVTIPDLDQMNSRERYPWTCRQLDRANVVGLKADRNSRHRPITHLRSRQRSRSLPLLAPGGHAGAWPGCQLLRAKRTSPCLHGHTKFIPAARTAPRVLHELLRPGKTEGAGKTGCAEHPQPRVGMKITTRA